MWNVCCEKGPLGFLNMNCNLTHAQFSPCSEQRSAWKSRTANESWFYSLYDSSFFFIGAMLCDHKYWNQWGIWSEQQFWDGSKLTSEKQSDGTHFITSDLKIPKVFSLDISFGVCAITSLFLPVWLHLYIIPSLPFHRKPCPCLRALAPFQNHMV